MASQASYDELMKQVLNLQRENTDLRRVLQNSSSQPRQIDTDSSAIIDSHNNVRLTVSETDTRAAAAAYDVAMGDTYASRQTPPTVMSVSDLGFADHDYSSSVGKFCYNGIFRLVVISSSSFL